MSRRKAGGLCLVLCLALLIGCASVKRDEKSVVGEETFGLYTDHTAPFKGGLLTDSGRVYVFDESEESMVPFCVRAECKHEYKDIWKPEEVDCPAAYLGLKAAAYAIYEENLWYVVTNDHAWEFWTADLNNENHEKHFEIEMTQSGLLGTSLFCQGYYYAPQMEMFLDEETGKMEVLMRIIKVDLKSGNVKGVTDWGKDGEYLFLVGVYGDRVYYRYNERDENGQVHLCLYCVSQENGETELLIEAGETYRVSMDQERLVCGMTDTKNTQIFCWNLASEEKTQIFEEEDFALVDVWVSGGDIVWGRWHEDDKTYSYYIYDSVSQEILETPQYSENHDRWTKLQNGWWCRAWKTTEEAGMLAEPDEVDSFYYIANEKLRAGEEMKRVQ